jgi:hypothetical protein
MLDVFRFIVIFFNIDIKINITTILERNEYFERGANGVSEEMQGPIQFRQTHLDTGLEVSIFRNFLCAFELPVATVIYRAFLCFFICRGRSHRDRQLNAGRRDLSELRQKERKNKKEP